MDNRSFSFFCRLIVALSQLKKAKGGPYSTTERSVPELISVLVSES